MPADECANADKNNIACGLLYQAHPEVCSTDCIGRLICPMTCGTCVKCKSCSDANGPNYCNTTEVCKTTQSCYAKESIRKDFSIGLDLQCMDDFICHAYFGGIIKDIRKRQFGANVRLRGQCCKTNLCNANGIIQPTTPPPSSG